jgi:hypothetical protein
MQKYKYPVFNKEAWKFNVNRMFFLFGLGALYSLGISVYKEFNLTLIDLLGRTFLGWTFVLLVVVLLEATLATIRLVEKS